MSEQQVGTVVGMKDERASTRNVARFNALKHGLTAKTPVLPGEDPAALQAKIDAYQAKYQTRDEVEGDLMEMAAMACWQVKRANRIEAHRVTRDVVVRKEADALRAGNEVAGLGRRLLFDRRGPWQQFPSRDYQNKQPRTSDSGELHDPDQPAVIKRELEASPEGCGWLLDRWFELRKPLENESEDGSGWISCQKFTGIRLLGKQPLDAIHDPEVAMVFLASHAIRPNFATAFDELRCETHYDRVEFLEGELDREEWTAITPADTAAGRKALLEIVDKAIDRLLGLEAERREVADFLEEVQSNIPSDGESKTIAQIQRHRASANRLMLRNIDTIERARRNEAEGWGKARREREKLKADARLGRMQDLRFVIHPRGTVRDSQDYDGDLDAGLARWKVENGKQPFERYGEAVQGGGPRTEDEERRAKDWLDPECGSAGGFESRTGDGEVSGLVPVSLMGQGAATKIQNEIEGLGGSDQRSRGEGATGSDQGGRREGAAAAGMRNGEASRAVALSLMGQEPATETQNEIGGGNAEQDGGGCDEACGRSDGGDGSVARDPRQTGEVDGAMADESGNSDSGNSRSETCNVAAECADAESLVVAPVEGGPPESPERTTTAKEDANAERDAAADPPAISLDSLIEIALQNLDGD